jgi:hypothetical protein
MKFPGLRRPSATNRKKASSNYETLDKSIENAGFKENDTLR